jgi:Ca-activated chloride channel family protein
MFRFEHPGFFWAALIPALLIGLYFVRKHLALRDWSRWGAETSNQKIFASQPAKPQWLWLGIPAALLLVIAFVNPQWGYKTVAVETKTADIYILMDISNSMLAQDVAPSRLERARRFGLDLSTAFRTDKVGLILFAGNAYMQSPLTTDWHAIQLYLGAAGPDQAGTQGTAIGEAVRLALKPKQEGEPAGHGALIILTDGEDHDSDAPSAVVAANEAGWITYIVGIGTEEGATIPISIDGSKDVKRDETGQPVKTALNRPLMTELAQKGHGKYYDLSEGNAIIDNLKKELAGLERNQLEKRSFSEHRSYFQWFLLPALLLMLILTVVNYKYDVV